METELSRQLEAILDAPFDRTNQTIGEAIGGSIVPAKNGMSSPHIYFNEFKPCWLHDLMETLQHVNPKLKVQITLQKFDRKNPDSIPTSYICKVGI